MLTGGLGTRLRPLTSDVPKPLVLVANRALISYPLAVLGRAGIQEAILACGYRADKLRAGIERLGDLALAVTFVEEEEPLDTAGAVRNALTSTDRPFIVMNGDQVTDVDVTALLEFHASREADLSIVVRPVPDVSAYGLVPCDTDGRVQEFGEKRPSDPTGQNLVNTGVYVFSPAIIDDIPEGEPYSNERQLFPGLVRDGRRVFAFRMDEGAFWADVGTPANYLEANRELLQGALPGADLATIAGGAEVSPGASLVAPVSLADGCRIDPGTEVGPNVSVGERATIAEAAVVRNSILWPSSSVGRGCQLENAIVAPGYHVREGTVFQSEEAAIIPGDNDGDNAE